MRNQKDMRLSVVTTSQPLRTENRRSMELVRAQQVNHSSHPTVVNFSLNNSAQSLARFDGIYGWIESKVYDIQTLNENYQGEGLQNPTRQLPKVTKKARKCNQPVKLDVRNRNLFGLAVASYAHSNLTLSR